MLKYGKAYLELNDIALELLTQGMSPAAIELALEMASEQDEEEPVEDDEFELA